MVKQFSAITFFRLRPNNKKEVSIQHFFKLVDERFLEGKEKEIEKSLSFQESCLHSVVNLLIILKGVWRIRCGKSGQNRFSK